MISASLNEPLKHDLELPLDLLDIIYDELVRVRLEDRLPERVTQWTGADCIRLSADGHDVILDGKAIVPLRSEHDGIQRGHLQITWPLAAQGQWLREQRLQVVSRHVATALAYRAELVSTRRKYEVFADGLDRLSVGAMIVQEDGQPIDANRIARRILDQRDGLSLIGGKICAATPVDQKALRALMDAVTAGKVLQGGTQLQRPSGAPDLYVLVLQRPHRPGVIRTGMRVLLRDPSAGAVQSRSALINLYGLTGAEAAITFALANGRAPGDVERDLSIRHNTMRAHLRSIYTKLGIGSHAELVFTVLTGGATLAADEDNIIEPLESIGSVVGEPR